MGHLLHNITGSGACVHCTRPGGDDFLTALAVLALLFLARLFLYMKRSKKAKLSPSAQDDPER